MDGSELNAQLRASNERVHHQRPVAPKPPRPYNSINKENEDSLTNRDTSTGKKLSGSKERPAFPPKTNSEGGHAVLSRAGETILETFYGMLYKCEDDTKEWKLVAEGFIPLCFIQEQGNTNKPFKVIAVHGSVRVLELTVTKDIKCTQNRAFVKWNESNSNIFGVRFSKESQADQFYSAMSRMKSTLLKTTERSNPPERKQAMASKTSDRAVDVASHRKTSLIVKLPNKETTVMSVPGSMTMGELLEHVCNKEELSPNEHQLTLPKVGSKGVKFEQDTVLGTLKIREISLNYTGRSPSGSAIGDAKSHKESHKATAAKTPVIPQSYSKQEERPATTEMPSSERKALPVEKDKSVPPVKPDSGKVKRRAPPPPQRKQPPERPKSMPVVRPRSSPSGPPTTSPGPPQAKKRQAPSRPPAPKMLRNIRNSDEANTSNIKRSESAERLPPIFCPPPPPDDVPPPLDECGNPVRPLSDDDLHDAVWRTSSFDHESSEVTLPSSNITKQAEVLRKPSEPSESDDPEDRTFASPEPIPLKFLIPSSESSVENAVDLTDREGVSSRISFVGDSRSSSVDITSDTELPISPTLEDFKPIEIVQPVEMENYPIKSNFSAEEPHTISPPSPPLVFSTEPMANETSMNSLECDIESMVVPPPPVMFSDSTESQDVVSENSTQMSTSDEVFSIPPPSDFAFHGEIAHPPPEFIEEETSTSAKKKLGLSSSMFPWLTETQPVFKAEISNSSEEQTEKPLIPEKMDEGSSFKEKHHMAGPNESRDVAVVEPPSVGSNEKRGVESLGNDHISTSVSSKHLIETPDQHKESVLPTVMKLNNNERDPKSPSIDESDQLVSESCEIPAPEIFKNEPSQRLNVESHHIETSSESSSSTFKTPFDDLESIEYSEGSLNSELEEDTFDLKVTSMNGENSHAQNAAHDQNITIAVANDSFIKPEPLKEKDVKEDQSLSFSKNEFPQFDTLDEFKGDNDDKFSEKNEDSKSTVTTTDDSVSSASGKSDITEEVIETSNVTPIAIPVDILFQSLESNATSEVTDLQGDVKDKPQARTGLKRPVSSGFKTQSWADIKKNMENQRQQNNASKRTYDTTIPKPTPSTMPTTTPVVSTSMNTSMSSATMQSELHNANVTPSSTSIVSSSNNKLPSTTELTSKSISSISTSTIVQTSERTEMTSLETTTSKEKSPLNFGKRKPNYVESAKHVDYPSTTASAVMELRKGNGISTQHVRKYDSLCSSAQSDDAAELIKSDTVESANTKVSISQSTLDTSSEKSSSADHIDTQSLIFPSMFERSKGKSTTTQEVKKSDNLTGSTQNRATAESSKSNNVASANSNTMLTPISVESSIEKVSEEVNKTDDEKSISPQSVVIRKKPEKQDSTEKRKSVHDMMKMFQIPAAQDLERERRDSSEGFPRQSPALRILEEKVNCSYRRSSSETHEMKKDSDSVPNEKGVNEDLPKQSPSLRLLEGNVGHSNRFSGSTTSVNSNPSQEENNNLKSTETPRNELEKAANEHTESSSLKETTEPKQIETKSLGGKPRASSLDQRKSYGILFPMEYKPPSYSVETKPKVPETSDKRPRANSSNPRQRYEVLFPKEKQSLSNSAEANTSVEAKEQKGGTSDINLVETKRQSIDEKISITHVSEESKTVERVGKEAPKSKSENKKEIANAEKSKQRRSVDESVLTKATTQSKKDDTPNTGLVIMRKKESLTVSDSTKRYSMPVHLMESAPKSQGQAGGNLKILLAPQISDVGVVPKGRVAAMMAAWKKDDQQ